jgi:hypothetical protein
LNLKIGDLLSHPLSPATRQPFARPFMLTRPIQAHSCMFAHVPVQACAPATRAHPLLKAIFSHALSRVFQEPKTLPEYKHFEPSVPFEPFTGKKTHFFFWSTAISKPASSSLCLMKMIETPRPSHHKAILAAS